MYIHTQVEILLSIFKLVIIYHIFANFGLLKGIITIAAIIMLNRYILRLFGLEKLHLNDVLALGFKDSEKFNCLCLFTFETFDSEAVKSILLKGIAKHPKFRKRLVSLIYLFFWKDIQDVSPGIRIINKRFATKDDLISYFKSECNVYIDMMNSLPYDIQIINYGERSGGVLFKVDHSFSDGLGMDLFTAVLSDNYDQSVLPSLLKMGNNISIGNKILLEVLNFITFPYYSAKLCLSSKYLKSQSDSLFKRDGGSSGETNVGFSKIYSFKTFHDLSKSLGISFNDICLSILSAAISKYSHNKYNYSHLVCAVPIGIKNTPNRITDVQVSNDILGSLFKLYRIDDPKTQYKLICNETRETVKNYYNIGAWKYFSFLCDEFMPYELAKKLFDNLSQNVDLTISNLPGPTKAIYFSGYEVKDIFPLMSVGTNKCFIIIGTYNDRLRITVSVDRMLGINTEELINCINNEFDTIITI